jgi:ketosteroid isomerase-like protein
MVMSRHVKLMIIAFALAVAGAGGANAQRSPTRPDTQADTQAITKVLKTQVAAWNRGDIGEFMFGYWRSRYTEFENDSGVYQGWDDVLKRYEKAYPNRAAMGQLTFSGLEIHVLCPDSAYVIGKYRLDRKKDHPEGVFTLIFRRFSDGWKIVNDHTTSFQTPKQ